MTMMAATATTSNNVPLLAGPTEDDSADLSIMVSLRYPWGGADTAAWPHGAGGCDVSGARRARHRAGAVASWTRQRANGAAQCVDPSRRRRTRRASVPGLAAPRRRRRVTDTADPPPFLTAVSGFGADSAPAGATGVLGAGVRRSGRSARSVTEG